MTERNTTIALNESEKERLDNVAEDVFGESDTIPYGCTVSYLLDAHEA
ncbi:hypothetical protein [Haloarcula amylovorans]|nr:hypothetical protein [Halomicroarcula amylolytica]